MGFKGNNFSQMVNLGMTSSNSNTWCADFVVFCLEKKGIKASKAYNSSSQQFIGFDGFHSRTSGYTPKTGDIYVLTGNYGGGPGTGHAGIVHSVSGSGTDYTFTTIDGNFSGKVSVDRQKYNYNSKYLTGFWSPSYSSGSGRSFNITKKSLGPYLVTGYCSCSICCGKWANGITATGTTAKANWTIAVDKNKIPYGSYVLMDNHVYHAEDCGGAIKNNHIDRYFNTHQEALNWGNPHRDLYLLSGTESELKAYAEYVNNGGSADISGTKVVSPPKTVEYLQWNKGSYTKKNMQYVVIHTACVPATKGDKAAVDTIINALNSKGLSVQAIATASGIYHTAPWDSQCGHIKSANEMCIGLEACESGYLHWNSNCTSASWDSVDDSKVREYHEKLYDIQVQWAAWICYKYNIPVSHVKSHMEMNSVVRSLGRAASDHGDPEEIWDKFEKAWGTGQWNMTAFRNKVQEVLNNASTSYSSDDKKTTVELNSTNIISVSGENGEKRALFDWTNNEYSYGGYELYIQNTKGQIFRPCVVSGVKWSTGRVNTVGKLSFSVLKDSTISFNEGSAVIFKADGKGVFYGYVFEKSRDDNEKINVTAYDQLRYFKNKHTYVINNMKASEILKMICDDFKLTVGDIEDSQFVIDKKIEDNQDLFTIISNAITETYNSKGARYILYDDCGKICFKNTNSLKLNLNLTEKSLQSFSYSTSIDNAYNRIILYKDSESGCREMKVYQDGESISKWGMLQYSESYDDNINPDVTGSELLKQYNIAERKLSLKNVLGHKEVRAGSQLHINLNLGDILADYYMMVDSVTHNFYIDKHSMDIDLIRVRDANNIEFS